MSRPRFGALRSIPGYAAAKEVPTVEAKELTEHEFFHAYVERRRPCLVKRAILHWPAMHLWRSTDYLMNRVGPDRRFPVRTHPLPEYDDLDPERYARMNQASRIHLSFREFLERATSPGCGHLLMRSCALEKSPNELRTAARFPLRVDTRSEDNFLTALGPDVWGFDFLANARRPRSFPSYRVFFFRNSFTDWHFHVDDETLMTQVVGRKEVMLLPPDEASWKLLWRVIEEHGCTFDEDVSAKMAGGEYYRTVVEEGDALYIPIYWWHAVESIDDVFGATVAATFATPHGLYGDLRLPGARRNLRRLMRSHDPLDKVDAVVATVASYSRRLRERVRGRAH